MQVSIKTVKGKSINLDVEDSSETIDVKIHGEPIRQVVLDIGPDPGQGRDAAIQIFVTTLGGKTLVLQVERSATIAQVMAKIQEKGGPQVKDLRLIYQGTHLDSNRSIADYNITNDLNLVIMSRLCGC